MIRNNKEKINIENFDRKEQFLTFNTQTNPFLIVTIPINIRGLHLIKHNYSVMGFLIQKAIENIENFHYRIEEHDDIYYYKNLDITFTILDCNKNVDFIRVGAVSDIDKFTKSYLSIKRKSECKLYELPCKDQGEIWVSSIPWYTTNGVNPPFDKNVTIPQFIYDKFEHKGNQWFTNLTIMVHHGFVDPYHIGLFKEKLEYLISKLEYDNSNNRVNLLI